MSSVVAFARQFSQLKAELSRDGEADLRLTRLVDFSRDMADTLNKPAYASYLEEWCSLVEHQLEGDEGLQDLTPGELHRAAEVCDGIVDEAAAAIIHRELARKLCYVGEVEKALAWLNHDGGDDSQCPSAAAPADATDEYDAARQVVEALPSDSPLTDKLEQILGEWRLEREALSFDSVKCLFVDKGGQGTAAGRGRIRTLVCKNADTTKEQETNEVVFDNQVRGPDDPFVGASYTALDAVGSLLQREGTVSNGHRLRVHLAIENSNQTFTGDSIALAVALVSYAQLMKPQIHRHERFIAGEIAVTGSLATNGSLLAVNADSIHEKIERAFFSPVKYVVVPRDNAVTARDCIEKLRQPYPRRRLQVIAHERLQDVIDDHNVIRPEKVCWAPYVARKAKRYTGSVKVQVPILLGLAWLLLAILWPKYFDPWFDRSPAYVRLTERGFEALNRDSIHVWDVEYECDSLELGRHDEPSMSKVWDLDGDGKNEVLFMPRADEATLCDINAMLHAYDSNGDLLFCRQGHITRDIGNQNAKQNYKLRPIMVIGKVDPVIITQVYRSLPARTHIRFWSAGGDSLGWYVYRGHMGGVDETFTMLNDSVALFLAYCNKVERTCLFALNLHGCEGVAPPYDDSGSIFSGYDRGNQYQYITFPRSPINRISHSRYNYPVSVFVRPDGRLQAEIQEADKEKAKLVYVLDSSLRIQSVMPSDVYENARRHYIDDGRLVEQNSATHYDALRDSVLYWTDSGWVSEARMRATQEK